MLTRALLVLLPFAVFAAACGDKPISAGAVRVVVQYPDFLPACVRVTATDAKDASRTSSVELTRDELAGKSSATIAVFRSKDWSNELLPSVESFETTPCTGAPLEVHAAPAPFLIDTTIKEWTATLAAVDGDGDLFAKAEPASNVAGTDCDDAQGASFPGATEACAGADSDCDGKIRCADEDCLDIGCDDLNDCTEQDVCVAGGGCAGRQKACSTPPATGCAEPLGTCALGNCEYAQLAPGTPCDFMMDAGVCTNQGLCGPPNTEFNCADGLDNDGDKDIDCNDADCVGSMGLCTDGDPCTDLDRCVSDGVCLGTPKTCTAGPCRTARCEMGTCVETVDAGAPCDDGRSCTATDVCRMDATCGGDDTCSTTAACLMPAGMCQADSSCAFTPNPGAPCDDANPATAADLCQADAGCQGTPYTCPPPGSECLQQPVPQGDGGCTYPISGAMMCTFNGDAGVCLGDGGCVPAGGWPYAPSNFNPSTINAPMASALVTCNSIFDTAGASFLTMGCTFPVATTNVTLSDGRSALVVATQDLTVSATGSISFVSGASNPRPAILAVAGDAFFDGPIFANTQADAGTIVGAGAGYTLCGASNGASSPSGDKHGGGGAGFGSVGGRGGRGNGETGFGPDGGVPATAFLLEPLRAGCRGGQGGQNGGGLGGIGGGALQISVAGDLTVNNIVSVSGAGGRPGNGNTDSDSAGGGGGSGGMLVLEGDTVLLSAGAKLTANGGGGGGGAQGNVAGFGFDGDTDSAMPAPGGLDEGGGGPGGDGGSALAPATPGSPAAKGGGGGGGAVGVIHVRAASTAMNACVNLATVKSPPLRVSNNCTP